MTAGATRFYLGAYTASSGGSGMGLGVYERPTPTGEWGAVQVVAIDDPSFVVLTEGEVHAVSETPAGRLASFTVAAGELVPATLAASGGASPCHLLVDPASGALVITNYAAGTFAVVSADALDPGRVARVLPLPDGHGPVADRQEAPHAHSSTATPWGTLLVSDLGTDRLFEFRVDPVTLEPEYLGVHVMPEGTGPRHFDWLDGLLLVAGELDGRLHVLSRVTGGFRLHQSIPAYDAAVELGGGEALPSHVEVREGRVYVGVRGRDTISVFAPEATGDDAQGADPAGLRLGLVAEVPCGGRWPRHFAFDGPDLYVANQLSHTVSILRLDEAGVPGETQTLIETGSPACIVFA